MKKSVGIITFHASHNYGSMLQAYALQQVLLNLGFDCEIINFRTEIQKKLYCLPYLRGNFGSRIKHLLAYLPFLYVLKKKDYLFESFLIKELKLSSCEFSTSKELELSNLQYDYYISGSDQIWNIQGLDFDWAYFLSFIKNKKKVAYAPSMGPFPFIDEKSLKYIAQYIADYDAISVREQSTVDCLKGVLHVEYPLVLDPTLLLPSTSWSTWIGEEPIFKGEYIFLYAPCYDASVFKMAQLLSKQLKLKVVVSQLYGAIRADSWLLDSTFTAYLKVGPKEFLNLCKYATCTIGKSFHLAIFSILLNVPFFIIDGLKDSRTRTLLQSLKLTSQAIDSTKQSTFSLDINFEEAFRIIEKKRGDSLKWLQEALG